MHTVQTLENNRTDIALIDKKNKTCSLNDAACLFDTRSEKKE